MFDDELFGFVSDMDFDGDHDLVDYLLEEDELNTIMAEEDRAKHTISYGNFGHVHDSDFEIVSSNSTCFEEYVRKDFCEKEEKTENVTDRIFSSFIRRDFNKEKELGIDDIKFYCYWLNGFSGVLIIIGEIISHGGIVEPFYFKAIAKDEEGDKILVEKNFDYTGGAGLIIRSIYPQIAYNRYPIEFELHISPQKLEKSTVHIIPIKTNEGMSHNRYSTNINFNKKGEGKISVAELKQYDKIPKSIVDYYIPKECGLTNLKVNFFKNNDIYDDDYFLDQLSLTYEYSGRLSKDVLMYILIYNEKDELIQFLLTRLDEGDWEEEEGEDFINIPHGEKISHIVICTTFHPINFCGPDF